MLLIFVTFIFIYKYTDIFLFNIYIYIYMCVYVCVHTYIQETLDQHDFDYHALIICDHGLISAGPKICYHGKNWCLHLV